MTVKLAAITIVGLLSFSALQATAQSGPYPNKVIRIVNPLAAGGNQDIVARAVAEQLSRIIGQQVIVENRPGASAILGTKYVKSSAPDGYTLLAMSNTYTRVPAIVADAGYDPINDFIGVTQTCDIPMVLSVNPALPVKSIQELVALAKKRPGELTYGSSGLGSTGHVAAELISRKAGIKMLHVPYKGNAPATSDLVGGQIMLMFDQVSTSAAYIKAGRLRALGVTSLARSPLFPDVPTIDESGVKGYVDTTFNGLMAPAGTPRDILDKVRSNVAKAVAVPEVRNRFGERGIELVASKSLDEYASFIRKQVTEFAVLAKAAGLKAN